MDRVAEYFIKMLSGNDPETAMAFTLEMFEGLSEGQVDYVLSQYSAAA